MHHQFTQKRDAILKAFLWLLLGHDKHNTSFENIQSKLLSPEGISGCLRRFSLRLQVKLACKTNKLAFLIKNSQHFTFVLAADHFGELFASLWQRRLKCVISCHGFQHGRPVCVSSDKTIFQLQIKGDRSAG